MTGAKIAVVLPTRNRSDMAITAVRFLLRQPGCDLEVFVSDNSSNGDDVRRLAAFCDEIDNPCVTYMRAPENLGQSEHWDWAVREALDRSNATHVTVHYDRKIVRPGAASAWFDAADRRPDKVITYLQDFSSADPPPLRTWQHPWTGRLYRLRTARTIAVTARGQAQDLGQSLPILSNCIVPRAVIEAIVERFGDLCVSTTGDSCFTYRFCALFDEFLHLDRPLSVLYGSHRSAGVGYLKGNGGDFADYRQTWRGEAWLDAAIIPGLNLGYNMLFHEYELVRRVIGGDRFPPLDRAGCLRDLARSLFWIADAEAQARMCELLKQHGWDGDGAVLESEPRLPLPLRAGLFLRQRIALFLADYFSRPHAGVSGYRFMSERQAVRYVLRYPLAPVAQAEHLALAEAEEVEDHVQ